MMDSDVRDAALAGLSGVGGSYLVAGYTRQFVVAPIDAVVVRATPGPIVAWMITNVGERAHLLHVALSIAVAVALLGAAAVAGRFAAEKLGYRSVAPGLAGGLVWGLAASITTEPVLALGAAVPVVLFMAVRYTVASALDPAPDRPRRRVLGSVATALGFVALAGGLGWLESRDDTAGTGRADTPGPEMDDPGNGPDDVQQRLQRAEEYSLDLAADDVPGLVSSIAGFYNVDIAEFDPEVPDGDWSLTLTGHVENDRTLAFGDLTDRPTEHRFLTLRCVGENLNGRKLDTAVWTGTRVKPLLDAVDPDGDCGCAMLRAEDGYFVQFPVDALEDALLVWGMNGEPLPKAHGHPVRALVPGHWGETNVKWISEIELLDEAADGYWEKRGWHGTGPVNTVAKLWDDTRLSEGRIEVAGHAYAGTRGIERVEVSTDGGETWSDADLSRPLPDEDVWRQWRHVYRPEGNHEVVVRAVDGDGNLQPRKRSDSFPSGATGWVSKRIRP